MLPRMSTRIPHVLAVAGALAAGSLAVPAAADAVLVYAKGQAKPSVWVAGDDGAGARRLADGGSAHVAPDGKTVLFTPDPSDGNPELHAIPAAGGQSRQLLRQWRDAPFAWSPDSRHVVTLTGPEDGTQRLVLLDLRDGGTRTLAQAKGGNFFGASFSPSGDRLVYSVNRGGTPAFPPAKLYVARTAGGAPEPLRTGRAPALDPVWGPRQIAYSALTRPPRRNDAPKSNLWLVDPDGGQPRRLTRDRPGRLLSGLTATAWSPDGRRMLAQFGGQDTSWLVTLDPASGRQRTIGPKGSGKTGFTGVRLSKDGSTILAQRGGAPDQMRSDVIALPYDGGAPQVLARDAYGPDWNR